MTHKERAMDYWRSSNGRTGPSLALVSDATWEVLYGTPSREQMMMLASTAGWYQFLAEAPDDDAEAALADLRCGVVTTPQLSPNKVGVAVFCKVCDRRKNPVGRFSPSDLCDHDCEGYNQDPQPGSLHPGESEDDFGHPVGVHGVEVRGVV